MASQRIAMPMHRVLAQRSTLVACRGFAHRRFASSKGPIKLVGPMDNAFNRERMAVKQHAAQSADLWRKLCIYVVIPAVILAGLNAKNLWDEHWEHWEHMPPMSERPQYSYLNIRTKAFPWGDGDKTLFWNDKVNWKPPKGE